jgi:hypothetical protein
MKDVQFAFDSVVRMAYGRCLRPALYSSLRSSPSHLTGVSALRVTIAIASARCARKKRGLCKSTAGVAPALSQSIAHQPTCRGHAVGRSTAMTRTAFRRKSLRVPRVRRLGSWAVGISDRGGQDKARKVRAGGREEEVSNFKHAPNLARYRSHLAIFGNAFSPLNFRHPMSQT